MLMLMSTMVTDGETRTALQYLPPIVQALKKKQKYEHLKVKYRELALENQLAIEQIAVLRIKCIDMQVCSVGVALVHLGTMDTQRTCGELSGERTLSPAIVCWIQPPTHPSKKVKAPAGGCRQEAQGVCLQKSKVQISWALLGQNLKFVNF